MYEAKIQRGIEWLNSKFGKEWVNDIDLWILDMDHIDNCILGQLFKSDDSEYLDSGFDRGCKKLANDSLSPLDGGFDVPVANASNQRYAFLRLEWHTAIMNLRSIYAARLDA